VNVIANGLERVRLWPVADSHSPCANKQLTRLGCRYPLSRCTIWHLHWMSDCRHSSTHYTTVECILPGHPVSSSSSSSVSNEERNVIVVIISTPVCALHIQLVTKAWCHRIVQEAQLPQRWCAMCTIH